MKKIIGIGVLATIIISLGAAQALASSTMTWGFQVFNNPNARQVALNLATAQQELAKVTNEQTALERFRESLDRMTMSKAVRDIVYYDPNSDDPSHGFVPTEDGWIYYEWDTVSQAMKIFYWSGGAWTEITIDSYNPPTAPGH